MGNAEGKEASSSKAGFSSLPSSSSSTTPLLMETANVLRRHQPNRLPADRDFLNVLVIIGGEERERYARYFAKHGRLYGTHELRVYCALWADIRLSSYSSARQGLQCQADIRLEHEKRYVSITVDFVLIRSQVMGARPEEDWRNVLYGFMYANVPSVNSFHSIYMATQRVLMMGECNRIREAVGHENYPIVDQNYYARAQDMAISPSFPAVLKVSGSHAGFGKTIVSDHHHWADLRSVIMVTGHYATAEEFIEGDYDLRIQRIASGVAGQPPHYRCLKRINISGNWKGNTGSAILEVADMTEEYQRWADLSAQLFGGLDILAVDVIHCSKTGKEYILEVNDTSIGLASDDTIALEDETHIVELCINRIKQHYPNPAESSDSELSSSSSSSSSAIPVLADSQPTPPESSQPIAITGEGEDASLEQGPQAAPTHEQLVQVDHRDDDDVVQKEDVPAASEAAEL